MFYTATTSRESLTLRCADGYNRRISAGASHADAMRDIRRQLTRKVIRRDLSALRPVHDAMRAAMVNAADDENVRAIVNAAGRAALVTAVRIAPAVTVDGEEYAPGMIRAALQVARKTLVRACEHGGTDTQRAALRDLDVVNAAAVRYDVAGMEWDAAAPAILATLATVGHDAQDMYSEAMTGISGGYVFDRGTHAGRRLQGTTDTKHKPTNAAPALAMPLHRAAIRAAYLTANRAMHKQRAAAVREVWTEYIRQDGGDLIAVGVAIARIIKGGECWTETDIPAVSRVDVEALHKHLPRALALCRPVQKQIAGYLANGYSVNAIAEKLNRDRRTVQRNVAIMRGTCAEYIRENAPSLLPMFNADKYTAQAVEAENAKDTAHANSANSRRKAGCAEYYREYRARKRAEKEAAANE